MYEINQAHPLISNHAMHWVLSEESYEINRRKNISGWNLMEQYSSPDVCIYQLNKQAIIAFRGTSTRKDIISDIQLSVTGAQTFQKIIPSRELVEMFLNETDDSVLVQITGHSLGGAIARIVGNEFNLGVVTFNAAAPPSNPVDSNLFNQVHYHTVFDIISAWQNNCIRLDTGIRPPKINKYIINILPKYQLMLMSSIASAHSLDNYLASKMLIAVDSLFEEALLDDWFEGLPLGVKNFIRIYLAFKTKKIPDLQ